MLTFRSSITIVLIALSAVLLAGNPAVADKETSAVKGKVTLNGKPLAKGRIFFHLDNDQFVGAKIKNGDYTVDKVPAGTWRITVEGAGIPATYTIDNTTPLRAKVGEDNQTFDLDLKGR